MDLVIKQYIDRTETVNSSLIDALYHLTKPDPITGQPAANAVLVGRLQAAAAYEDAVSFLNAQFSSSQDNGSDLQITVSNNNFYIRFADEEVVRVLTENGIMEEGGGLTVAQAAVANVPFSSLFFNNTVVKNFDELRYFDKYKTTGGSRTQEIFEGAVNLESVDLTGTQSTGLYWAFKGCHSLEWYHGKSGPKNVLNLQWRNVSSIQGSAFEENYGLHEVTSLGIVTILDGSCFKKCTNLTTIDISNITTINLSAFEGDGNLEYFSGSDSTAGELNLPNLTGTLGNNAFKGCTKLTSVASLGSITSIGNSAFENCVNLATINIPSTVASVGANAFNNTAWYVNQPNGVVYINTVAYAIKGNTSSTITLNSNTTMIIKSFLSGHSEVTSLVLNEGLEIIEADALTNNHLQAFHLPSTVNSFADNRCFNYANAVTVASGNTKYDSRDNCNAIIETSTNTLLSGCPSTVIPNTVTKIGVRAFNGCPLTSINIPNSVTELGPSAFDGCKNMTGDLTVPGSVKKIGSRAFAGCGSASGNPGLNDITFQEGVEEIGTYCFEGCRIKGQIQIASTVSLIGQNFLIRVGYVSPKPSVKFMGSTPPTFDKWTYFEKVSTVYVPQGSLAAYQAAYNNGYNDNHQPDAWVEY